MDKALLSVGLDVGTTTTQMVLSRLTVENRGGAFQVPRMEITGRELLYQSPVWLTPLLRQELVDGQALRQLVAQGYRQAGLRREQVDTGAVIITGETSRKENARAVLDHLSEFAGDFVVATAGPHLESVLAARGAGAVEYSARTGKTVLHMDIGGGTSNLALIRDGQIAATGCLNVGGRLVKLDEKGQILYRSPVLAGLYDGQPGQSAREEELSALCGVLARALEMAAGLCPPQSLLEKLWTAEAGPVWEPPRQVDIISFSGGVAACMAESHPTFAFGDLGVLLGRALKESRLCRLPFRLEANAIRATVIGAGCHSTSLSGSTVFYRGIPFPVKNLPVIVADAAEQAPEPLARLLSRAVRQGEGPFVLALPGCPAADYRQLSALAAVLAQSQPGPVYVAMEADMAKALGHALALRLPPDRKILCLDRVALPGGSYLDVGAPIGDALPVVIKTLILEK